MEEVYLTIIAVILLLIFIIFLWRVLPWLMVRQFLIGVFFAILTVTVLLLTMNPVSRAVFLILIFLMILLSCAWIWCMSSRHWGCDEFPGVSMAYLMGIMVLSYTVLIVWQSLELRNLTGL